MIGTTLYIRDENRRVRDANGNIDERSKWVGYPVKDETRDSWILGTVLYKVNKKTLELRGAYRPGLDNRAYTAAEMEDAIWRRENHAAIMRLVQHADTAMLRKVAAALGL